MLLLRKKATGGGGEPYQMMCYKKYLTIRRCGLKWPKCDSSSSRLTWMLYLYYHS